MVNASDYAIIVGINRYQKFRELKGPENDGSSFKQWLVSTAGGDVPPANITEIYSNQFGGAAQGPFCSHIDIAFSNLFEKEDAGKIGRRLYVYFAGHGFGPSNNESALFTADATDKMLGSHIPGRLYADALETSGLFDELVLFMDCCRDIMQQAIVRQHPFTLAKRNNQTRRFLGFATRWGFSSREAIFPEGVSRGLFTSCLLQALNGGSLLGSELANYVYNGLPPLAKSFKSPYQDPEFIFDTAREIKFSESAGEQQFNVTVRFASALHGKQFFLRDAELNDLDSHEADDKPWLLKIKAGLFQVTGENGKGKLFQVTSGDQNVEIS